MTAFFLELLKEIGLFAILQEILKKKVEVALTPKGFDDNAFWREATSSLEKKEMVDIDDALNNHMTEQERMDFRLMIAIAQNFSRLKATQTKKGKKQPKPEPVEGFGTKILKGYLREFSDNNVCDISGMSTQMKCDLENPINPLMKIVNFVKKFSVDGFSKISERSNRGHEELMKALKSVIVNTEKIDKKVQKKLENSWSELKNKYFSKRRY
jgi:hypothetical protein